ncbi:site-2 protease family protein [Aeoliella sp.]|uniref:site-2 protease family protein n=1 Tax=Aeoliella sp. TaxID=2795800 RepID=UPI003CCB8313
MCVDFTSASLVLGSIDWSGYLTGALAILAAAAGLGFIIFVHELGHFLVAKACGVKCDKFMIGFDIGGYKIGKQVGETYYGIGILPLGGYVRMMGQNDDPRMSAEQIRESEATAGDEGVVTKEIKGPDGKMHQVDARSYIAKSVPQRMAIISAGVVMNVIFAFVFALIAFRIGVPSIPCVVGNTDPGAPAWVAGWRANDVVVRIDDIESPWFEQLQSEVTLSGKGEPVEFEIKRADSGELETYSIQPSRKRRKIAQIGIGNPWSLDLFAKDPAQKFTPAAEVGDKIPGGSQIVAVDGQPVKLWRDFQAHLAGSAKEPITLTLQPKAKKGEKTKPEPVDVTIEPNRAEYVGLVMKMGPIVGVQDGSPAAEAGLKTGDTITAINGEPIGMVDETTVGWDPRTLADRLGEMGRSGETVELTVRRASDDKSPTTETIRVPLRHAQWYEMPLSKKSPMSAPALGIAYYLLNEVVGIVPGSPAAEADIEIGDQLATVDLVIDEKYEEEYKGFKEPFELSDEVKSWSYILVNGIQDTPPGSKLKLELLRGEGEPKKVTTTVAIATDSDTYMPERGVLLMPIEKMRIGKTFGEQASMAWTETTRSLTSVYRFLNRIIHGDIDPRLLGGPITIAKASYFGALQGPGRLLIFLTLISANLAVVNFLPIPVLDGGHMVFLAWEGITRRPPADWVAGALNLAGLAFIVCLMLFVFGLDLGFIDRNL